MILDFYNKDIMSYSNGAHNNLILHIQNQIAKIYLKTDQKEKAEDTMKKQIRIVQQHPNLIRGKTPAENIFLWQNQLLQFYMNNNNIDKAEEYGCKLLWDTGTLLQGKYLQDLQYQVGNAFALKEGTEEDVDNSIMLYQLALENNPQESNCDLPTERIHNNLGVAYQYSYQHLQSKIKEEQKVQLKNYESRLEYLYSHATQLRVEIIKNLKKSTYDMTRENVAVGDLYGDQFINLQPGIIDEVFNPDPQQTKFIGDADYESLSRVYDQINGGQYDHCEDAFLPILNLGEIALSQNHIDDARFMTQLSYYFYQYFKRKELLGDSSEDHEKKILSLLTLVKATRNERKAMDLTFAMTGLKPTRR